MHQKLGLAIVFSEHGDLVFVNESAEIGNNCTLSQGATIEFNHNKAASVITKDIPNNATVAGNCAKVFNHNRSDHYICSP